MRLGNGTRTLGAGEMGVRLEHLLLLRKTRVGFPSTHVRRLTTSCDSCSWGSIHIHLRHPFIHLYTHTHTHRCTHTHTHTQMYTYTHTDVYTHTHTHTKIKKIYNRGLWRTGVGLVVKHICYPGLNPCDGSQPSATPEPRDPVPSLTSMGTNHAHGTHT